MSPSATSCGQLAPPALAAGKRAEGATLSPKGMEAKVGGYLPPARLELSTALQRPVVLPGQGPARHAALSGWGVSASSEEEEEEAREEEDGSTTVVVTE